MVVATVPIPSSFDRLRPILEHALRQRVGNSRLPLYDMLRYHLGWMDESRGLSRSTSPRIHGSLALVVAEALGGKTEIALPLAVAAQLAQGSLEVHEDLRLGSPRREHRSAVWWMFGHAQGINASDGILSLGRLAVVEAPVLNATVKLRALSALDHGCLQAHAACYQEIELAGTDAWTPAACLQAIEGEHGALVGAAAALGGIAAGADDRGTRLLLEYGTALGTAYRLRQEIEALTNPGAPELLVDLLDQKRLVTLLYALQEAVPKQRDRLLAVAERAEPIDDARLAEVQAIIIGSGALAQTEGLIASYVARAVKAMTGMHGAVALEAMTMELAGQVTRPSV